MTFKFTELVDMFYLLVAINKASDIYVMSDDLYSRILILKYKLSAYFREYEYQKNVIQDKYLHSDEYIELMNSKDEYSQKELDERMYNINLKIQEELNETVNNKELDIDMEFFSEDDFAEIIKSNINNSPIINTNQISTEEFFDNIYLRLVDKPRIL